MGFLVFLWGVIRRWVYRHLLHVNCVYLRATNLLSSTQLNYVSFTHAVVISVKDNIVFWMNETFMVLVN